MGWWIAAGVSLVGGLGGLWAWRQLARLQSALDRALQGRNALQSEVRELEASFAAEHRLRRDAEALAEDAVLERDRLRMDLLAGDATRQALTRERNQLRDRLSSMPPEARQDDPGEPSDDAAPGGGRRSSTGTLIGMPAVGSERAPPPMFAPATAAAALVGSGSDNRVAGPEADGAPPARSPAEKATDPSQAPPGRPVDHGWRGELDELRAELSWLRQELARAEDDKNTLLDQISGLEVDLGVAQGALAVRRSLELATESASGTEESGREAGSAWDDGATRWSVPPSAPRPRRRAISLSDLARIYEGDGSGAEELGAVEGGLADERPGPDEDDDPADADAAGADPLDPDSVGELEEAEIRRRAFELWDRSGRPVGRDEEFWLQAEHELLSPASRAG